MTENWKVLITGKNILLYITIPDQTSTTGNAQGSQISIEDFRHTEVSEKTRNESDDQFCSKRIYCDYS